MKAVVYSFTRRGAMLSINIGEALQKFDFEVRCLTMPKFAEEKIFLEAMDDHNKACEYAFLVAGVTSICAVAAKLNVSLCERAEPLIVLPGSYKEASKFLDGPGNKVLMKSASEIARVRDELKERGLIKNAAMVERCGLPGEKVYRDLNEIDPNSSYFSVILVKEKEFDK